MNLDLSGNAAMLATARRPTEIPIDSGVATSYTSEEGFR